MSKLLGPLSVTKSNVSWRDCAFAGENTAGADTMVAPASAAADLRKSRRFMEASGCFFAAFGSYALKGHARIGTAPDNSGQAIDSDALIWNSQIRCSAPPQRIAWNCERVAQILGRPLANC